MAHAAAVRSPFPPRHESKRRARQCVPATSNVTGKYVFTLFLNTEYFAAALIAPVKNMAIRKCDFNGLVHGDKWPQRRAFKRQIIAHMAKWESVRPQSQRGRGNARFGTLIGILSENSGNDFIFLLPSFMHVRSAELSSCEADFHCVRSRTFPAYNCLYHST